LDALRGLAALAVCWHHFQGAMELVPPGYCYDLADYGWLGVDVFFVLSGFVIPYSMSVAGYTVRDYPRFLLKRVLRVEPPYLVAVLLALVLKIASARMPEGYRGESFVFDPVQLALHVGYLNAIFGYPWFNEVFWTLAIEFQYYLLIGLLYVFLVHPSRTVRLAFYLIVGGISLLQVPKICIVPYAGEFLLGIACFHLRQGVFGRPMFCLALAALGWAVHRSLGLPHALAALAAALVIAFVHIDVRPLNWLGRISFSLYLIHGPVGQRVGKLVLRLTGMGAGKPLALAVSLTITIAFAYLFYLLIEKPATRWASRVRYGNRAA
jgi:peptidoglycan/LPS O-acetylase OafA/YrhL